MNPVISLLSLLTIFILGGTGAIAANTNYADAVLDGYEISQFPMIGQLPSYNTHKVFQDSHGIIWFGTNDGVCRYDGYHLNIFRSGITNATMLRDNDVLAINENARYYFLGSRKGLNILDKSTFAITAVPFDELSNVEIRSIQTADNGDVWIGTKSGLIRLSADMQQCHRYDTRVCLTQASM